MNNPEFVLYNGKQYGKPKNEAEARAMLQSYGLGPVELAERKIYLHKIPHAVIEDLIRHGAVMHAPGGLALELTAIQKYIVHSEDYKHHGE